MDKADKGDLAFLKRMKQKLGCNGINCGRHFTFEIGENEAKYIKESKRIYVGRCSKCNGVVKIRGRSLPTFCKTMGEPTIVLLKSEFNNIFTEE